MSASADIALRSARRRSRKSALISSRCASSFAISSDVMRKRRARVASASSICAKLFLLCNEAVRRCDRVLFTQFHAWGRRHDAVRNRVLWKWFAEHRVRGPIRGWCDAVYRHDTASPMRGNAGWRGLFHACWLQPLRRAEPDAYASATGYPRSIVGTSAPLHGERDCIGRCTTRQAVRYHGVARSSGVR